MQDPLDKLCVLQLNAGWKALDIVTPYDAIQNMMADSYRGLALDYFLRPDGSYDLENVLSYTVLEWDAWLELPVRSCDLVIHSPTRAIRVPSVVVCPKFYKMPMVASRLNLKALWARDGGRCQYTGRPLKPGEGNMDHVIPRAKGGATVWENVVLADKRVNARKADRLPHEAGLKLLKKPHAPRPLPSVAKLLTRELRPDWKAFIT